MSVWQDLQRFISAQARFGDELRRKSVTFFFVEVLSGDNLVATTTSKSRWPLFIVLFGVLVEY